MRICSKRLSIIALTLALSSPLLARGRVSGYCQQGNQQVITPGVAASTTRVMRSYPSCTVTVYLTGTVTPATIFSDNSGTALGNPFTAQTTGYWAWYADNGAYDVLLSGSGLSPFTLGALNAIDGSSIISSVVGGTGVTCTNVSGVVTCAIGQAVSTSSTPTFAALTLTGNFTMSGVGAFGSSTFTGTHLQNLGSADSPTFNVLTVTSCTGCAAASPLTPPAVVSGSTTAPLVTFTQNGAGDNIFANAKSDFDTAQVKVLKFGQAQDAGFQWLMQSPGGGANLLGWYDSSSVQRMLLNAQQVGTQGVRLYTPTVYATPSVTTDVGMEVDGFFSGGQAADIFRVKTTLVGGTTIIAVDKDAHIIVTLPTSCSGVAAGGIWNDTGTLKICP